MKNSTIRFGQKFVFKAKNSWEPRRATEQINFEPDSVRINDIKYGDIYPNSYLDLYIHNDSARVKHPTLIIFHGGGFVWGSKEDGDPNARSKDKAWFNREFVKAGFNIAIPEYAFAPDYLYPTPMVQLSEAVKWLRDHAGEYYLDMDHIVLNGGSAGAQLIGQFTNIQTNPGYAAEMGIDPVLPKESIRCCLFNSGLLDCERFGKTDTPIMSWLFEKCGEAYFNTRYPVGNPKVKEANVITHVTDNFPPSFISDANTASFTDQAVDFAKHLDEMGIRNELNIYPKGEKKLSHGFESTNDFYGQDNMKKMLSFVREQGIID